MRGWKTRNDQNSVLPNFSKGRRRRQRERYQKMELRVYVIISQLFQVILPAKRILSILE